MGFKSEPKAEVPDVPTGPWKYKYLYDGACSVCRGLVTMLKSRSGGERLYYVNIADPDYDAKANGNISMAEAMETIHVIDMQGTIQKGIPALSLLYDEVGLGWVFKLARLPLFSEAASILYKLVSKNRLALGGALDGILAAGARINAEEKGEGSCAENSECRDGYSKLTATDDAPAPAPAPPVKAADGTSAPAEATAAPPKEKVKGSALDRRNILGVYYTMAGGEHGSMMAAPVDVFEGVMLEEPKEVLVEANHGDGKPDKQDIGEALLKVIEVCDWKGVLGVGLPGIVRTTPEEPSFSDAPASSLSDTGAPSIARATRLQLEKELQQLCDREVVVLSGAEANGKAETLFGAGKGQKGLIVMCSFGVGLGVALFDDGVLVQNVDVNDRANTWTWSLDMWRNAPMPQLGDPEEVFVRWAERVESYITRLDESFNPDLIIAGGASVWEPAIRDKWLPLVKGVRCPVVPAQLGKPAGVIGAAVRARRQMMYRDDLSRVRTSIGQQINISPLLLTDDDLRKVFDSFDEDGSGFVTTTELQNALKALDVYLPNDEVRGLLLEADTEGNGAISFPDFSRWWRDVVSSSLVTYLHTEAAVDSVIAEEATTGRVVVLEVGFTFCKPCKRFEPIYKEYAKRFPEARFLRVNGNENADMVRLGRDRLGIKSSPSFYFFQNGKLAHSHSGAKEEKFDAALAKFFPDKFPSIP